MGDPLGLGDELSAAHFAVAVCEKPLVHLCWLHLEKETNADVVSDVGALFGRWTEHTDHAELQMEKKYENKLQDSTAKTPDVLFNLS